MARFIGVRIERAPRPFAEVVRVGGISSGTKRLTTIVPAQQIAEIELHLLRTSNRGAAAVESVRELHRFRIPVSGGPLQGRSSRGSSLEPGTDASQPVFDLKVAKVRGRRYTATVTEAGRIRDSAAITVPLRKGRIALIAILAVLLLLSVWGGFSLWSASQDVRGETVAADTTSSDINTPTVATAPAPPSETPPSETTPATPSEAASSETAPREVAPSTSAPPAPEAEAAPAPPPETTVAERARGTNTDGQEPAQTVPDRRVETTIYFGPDSVQLTPQGRRVLTDLVAELESHEIVSVTVEGHTALFGNEAGRERISAGRIEAVTQFLAAYVTLDEKTIETRSLGALEPVTRATAQQELNRRAEIVVTFRRDER